MMKSVIRNLVAYLLRPFLFFKPIKKGITVITFHNVLPSQVKWFSTLIADLLTSYEFINPHDLEQELSQKHCKPRLLLTFDDGFLSNKILAETVLEDFKIKSIFFITEGFIGLKRNQVINFIQEHFYPNSQVEIEEADNYLPMNWDDIGWLRERGHLIGAHTKTHPVLSTICNDSILDDEVVLSANRIGNRIGGHVKQFAFPFGNIFSVNGASLQKVRSRFKYSFSNIRGSIQESPDNSFLFRQNINPTDPSWFVKMTIQGKLDWTHFRVRRRAMRHVMAIDGK